MRPLASLRLIGLFALGALAPALTTGCTAGRVGQRELDAGGGGMDGDTRRDAGPRPDAGPRDDGGGGSDGGDAQVDSAIPRIESSCSDGMDNDGDGMADCADPDCEGRLCEVAGTVMCRSGSCNCGSSMSETSCGDGIDDDCDGMLDCADPECDGIVCGPGPVNCGGGACPCPDGFVERMCGNGDDDDCDSMTDCADPDCMGRPCGVAGFVCSAAMLCECPGAGMPEMLCDGNDDNCNMTVDEGCPNGITLSMATPLGPYGGSSGAPFVDACPAGAALIGIAGQAPTTLTQLQPICASMQFDENTEPLLHEYSVQRGPPIDGAPHGSPGAATFTDLCPGNTFAIGIRGDADMGVDQISLVCGEVSIFLDGGFNWRLSVSPMGSTPSRGSTGPRSGPFNGQCPTNAVVTAIGGTASSTRLTRLSATCNTVSLRLR